MYPARAAAKAGLFIPWPCAPTASAEEEDAAERKTGRKDALIFKLVDYYIEVIKMSKKSDKIQKPNKPAAVNQSKPPKAAAPGELQPHNAKKEALGPNTNR